MQLTAPRSQLLGHTDPQRCQPLRKVAALVSQLACSKCCDTGYMAQHQIFYVVVSPEGCRETQIAREFCRKMAYSPEISSPSSIPTRILTKALSRVLSHPWRSCPAVMGAVSSFPHPLAEQHHICSAPCSGSIGGCPYREPQLGGQQGEWLSPLRLPPCSMHSNRLNKC